MIQRFISNNFDAILNCDNLPRLAHICDVQETDAWPRILHRHLSYSEIVLIRKGGMSVILDDVSYETRKGDVIVYNSGLLHDERPTEDGNFCSYVCGVTGFKFPEYPKNWLPVGAFPVLHMGERAAYMEHIFRLILKEVLSDSSNPDSEEVCQYLLCSLITMLLTASHHAPVHNNDRGYSLGARIKSFIDEHYADNINLTIISESLQISTFYMAHVFREETGYSPIQYMINRRMGEAQSLLIQTDLPIRSIAQAVGYENINYFNQQFKKQTGFSPGKFRAAATAKDNNTT